MTATGVIYGLCGPDGIRYVGMTSRAPAARYAAHARDAAARKKSFHIYNWWRSLSEPPTLVLLEECAVDLLAEREQAWIAELREQGLRLCNHTSGGQGGVPDEITRAKISARARERYKDPAQRALTGAAGRRRFADPAERAKASDAAIRRFADPAYREKMSVSCVARYTDPVQRERQRDLTTRSWERMTPAQRAARCAAMSAGRARARELRAAA